MIIENLQCALVRCEQEVEALKGELEQIEKCRERGHSGSPLNFLEEKDKRDLAMYQVLQKRTNEDLRG